MIDITAKKLYLVYKRIAMSQLRKGVKHMYWITGILGAAFILFPWILGYVNNAVAAGTSYLIGSIVLLVSIIEGIRQDSERWEYWTATILGLAAIAAPFVLGFNHPVAMWTSVITGIMLAVMAGTRLYVGRR